MVNSETPEQRAKRLARMKAWREANRERFLSAQKRWRDERIGQCRARSRAYHREHRLEAAEAKRRRLAMYSSRIRVQKRDSRRRTTATTKARDRAYYVKNKARVLANVKAWAARNPERHRLNKQLDYHRRRAPGELTVAQWKAICLFYGHACGQCRASAAERPLTIDHYIPLAKGGTHHWTNVWPLCLPCNQSKHTTVPTGTPPHVAEFQASAVTKEAIA